MTAEETEEVEEALVDQAKAAQTAVELEAEIVISATDLTLHCDYSTYMAALEPLRDRAAALGRQEPGTDPEC